MKKIVKKNKVSTGKKIALGVGIAGATAGAYYLFGPKSKAHQKKAKMVLSEVKEAVEKKVKKLERITKPMYHDTVDAVAKMYHKQYKEHQGDINAFAKKIKSEWTSVQKVARPIVKKVKKQIKKSK